MVSVLPGNARSPWDLIGQATGQNLHQVLPGAVQQGYQRQQGLNAIDQLQNDLASANGDISKMLPSIARAYTLNPGLERSGLGQFALQNAKAQNYYGNGHVQQQSQPQSGSPNQQGTQQNPNQSYEDTYGVRNPVAIDAKAKQDAIASGDPARYQQSVNEQNTLNQIAQGYKDNLKALAKADGISDEDMPDFMEVGSKFPTENPDAWLRETRQAYAPIKKSFDALKAAFIPGIGSALMGRDRQAALKKIVPDTQKLVEAGREKQARDYLASQWLSPVEIAEQIHPIERKQEAALSKLPNGIFPAERRKNADWKGLSEKQLNPNPFVPYEIAKEKDPQAIQIMQDRLADFFGKNVDKDTSILALANKVWEDKSYHWDQMGPALRQAEKNGLKLEPHQQAEMSEINSQPPVQSLPDILKDWWRVFQNFQGAK